MPRQQRYFVPGVAAHIVQRGHNRAECFRRDNDYLDALIKPHAEFLALGNDAPHRYASYGRLIAEKLDPILLRQIEEAAESGYPLASDAFKADLAARLGLKTAPGRPGRPEKSTQRDDQPDLPEIGL